MENFYTYIKIMANIFGMYKNKIKTIKNNKN